MVDEVGKAARAPEVPKPYAVDPSEPFAGAPASNPMAPALDSARHDGSSGPIMAQQEPYFQLAVASCILTFCEGYWGNRMSAEKDPLAEFGLDAIDLRWTLKDIDSKRAWLINESHLPKLVELGLVEIRDGTPYLTRDGENAAWGR